MMIRANYSDENSAISTDSDSSMELQTQIRAVAKYGKTNLRRPLRVGSVC